MGSTSSARLALTATSVGGKRELKHCEQSCRALRQVLRQQEDLRVCEREMQELDNTKDQIMTLLKVGLANVGMWARDALLWGKLSSVWVGTPAAVLPVERLGHRDGNRGEARLLSV